MEFWDIYDINKRPTGRTMKRTIWSCHYSKYGEMVFSVL